MRFTIRDVLWLTVVVGLGVGWWLTAQRMSLLKASHQTILSKKEHLEATLELMVKMYSSERGEPIKVSGPDFLIEASPSGQIKRVDLP